MYNLLIFIGSCAVVAGSAGFFCYQGRSGLIAWIALLSLLANLFVLKQIDMLGFNATASDIFAVGSLLGLNLLQEKYDRAAAQSAIWISFSCLLFFLLMAQIHLAYLPSAYDQSQAAYSLLLTSSPRILLASLITLVVVDQVDSVVYARLRQYYPTFSPFYISSLSILLSQLLDTVLFSLLGLAGMVNAILEIIIVSYSIKIFAVASILPWSFLTQRFFVAKSC